MGGLHDLNDASEQQGSAGYNLARIFEAINKALGNMDANRQAREEETLHLLAEDVPHAASVGHPFKSSGADGLFERREQLPSPLDQASKKNLTDYAHDLIATKRIVKCAPEKGGKSKVWLDVPNGPFALGIGQIVPGHYEGIRLVMISIPGFHGNSFPAAMGFVSVPNLFVRIPGFPNSHGNVPGFLGVKLRIHAG